MLSRPNDVSSKVLHSARRVFATRVTGVRFAVHAVDLSGRQLGMAWPYYVKPNALSNRFTYLDVLATLHGKYNTAGHRLADSHPDPVAVV